jgi:uncharacterized protein
LLSSLVLPAVWERYSPARSRSGIAIWCWLPVSRNLCTRVATNCAALSLSPWWPFKLTAGAGQILAEQLSNGGIPIELLVNNAGFGLRGEFRAHSLPRQLEMLRLNNQAIVELTYSLLPGMLEREQKGIINISSTAGFQPIPFASAYSATKAFLTTFSLALEQELRGAGVIVVTLCPGRLHKNENGHSQLPVRGKWVGIYQTPEEVVEDALRVLANGGGLTVPGALNKFSVFAQRLLPRRIVPRLVAKLSKA